MGKEGREGHPSPVELLRQLTVSVGRLATEGIASGAVRGATEELRAGLPELDGQLQGLLQDVLTILGRMAHEAAEREAWPPGAWAGVVAEGAVRGAVEEGKRSLPDLSASAQELFARVNRLLERSAEVAASRDEELRTPGSRARLMATGAIEGALAQLQVSMPHLGPVVSELASQVGSGFVEGISAGAEEKAEVFATFLERVGRGFVHALVEQLDTELKARRGVAEGRVGRAAVEVAERAAAACVRGATGELVEHLRRPFVLAAGMGGVLLLGVFLAKAR